MTKIIYFPGLNGIRAIAAISVVVCHTTQAFNLIGLNQPTINGYGFAHFLGDYAVTIFFVLSGFLITYLLQAEKRIGSINIKKFYIRRALRIWPLYYLFLLINIALMVVYLKAPIDLNLLLFYIFFTSNIPLSIWHYMPLVYHYWSLAIEEQFYLFWPWINKKNKSITKPTLILIVALLIIKLAVHLFLKNTAWDQFVVLARFQCMMIGGLGAVFYEKKNKIFLFICDNRLTQFFCWALFGLAVINVFHIASIIDDELFSIIALILIVGQINVKNRLVNLDTDLFNFLGRLSYGIYIIHVFVIFLFVKVLGTAQIHLPYKYPVVYLAILGITIIIAYLSYTYFEGPFLKLKEGFARVHSSPTSNKL